MGLRVNGVNYNATTMPDTIMSSTIKFSAHCRKIEHFKAYLLKIITYIVSCVRRRVGQRQTRPRADGGS